MVFIQEISMYVWFIHKLYSNMQQVAALGLETIKIFLESVIPSLEPICMSFCSVSIMPLIII
jgi:hypothetical protein